MFNRRYGTVDRRASRDCNLSVLSIKYTREKEPTAQSNRPILASGCREKVAGPTPTSFARGSSRLFRTLSSPSIAYDKPVRARCRVSLIPCADPVGCSLLPRKIRCLELGPSVPVCMAYRLTSRVNGAFRDFSRRTAALRGFKFPMGKLPAVLDLPSPAVLCPNVDLDECPRKGIWHLEGTGRSRKWNPRVMEAE